MKHFVIFLSSKCVNIYIKSMWGYFKKTLDVAILAIMVFHCLQTMYSVTWFVCCVCLWEELITENKCVTEIKPVSVVMLTCSGDI